MFAILIPFQEGIILSIYGVPLHFDSVYCSEKFASLSNNKKFSVTTSTNLTTYSDLSIENSLALFDRFKKALLKVFLVCFSALIVIIAQEYLLLSPIK
jgi:hypothetical protein